MAPCSLLIILLAAKGTPSASLPNTYEIPSDGVTWIEKWLFPVTEVLSGSHSAGGLKRDERFGCARIVYFVDKEFLTGGDSDSENPRASGVITSDGPSDASVTPIAFFKVPEENAWCIRSSTKRGKFDPESETTVSCSILETLLGMPDSGNISLEATNFPENEILRARYSTAAEKAPLRCTETLYRPTICERSDGRSNPLWVVDS